MPAVLDRANTAVVEFCVAGYRPGRSGLARLGRKPLLAAWCAFMGLLLRLGVWRALVLAGCYLDLVLAEVVPLGYIALRLS